MLVINWGADAFREALEDPRVDFAEGSSDVCGRSQGGFCRGIQFVMAAEASSILRKLHVIIGAPTKFLQFPSRKQLLTENRFCGSFAEAFFPAI